LKDRVKKFFYNAIKKRLLELPDSYDSLDIKYPASPENTAAESCLKKLMIGLYPRMLGNKTSKEDIEKYFDHLFQLTSAAETDDLRFLDAYNNTYEIIGKIKWTPEDHQKYLIPFLSIYKKILSYHLKRLKK